MGAMRINLNELRQLILEAILNAYDVLGALRAHLQDAPPPPGPGAQPQPGGTGPGAAPPGTHRYFTYIRGRSRKFWEIERVGATLYVRYGRLGTTGKLWTRTYSNSNSALNAGRRMIDSKVAKGYIEGNVAGRSRPSQGAAAAAALGSFGKRVDAVLTTCSTAVRALQHAIRVFGIAAHSEVAVLGRLAKPDVPLFIDLVVEPTQRKNYLHYFFL